MAVKEIMRKGLNCFSIFLNSAKKDFSENNVFSLAGQVKSANNSG